MEAISRRQPERPFTERIDSKLTRSVVMEPWPAGQPCTVRFRRCSVSFVSERHFIGGETTRTVDHKDELRGLKLDVAHPIHGGPAVFRRKSAILQILMKVLPPLLRYHAGDEVGRRSWVEFVPAGLVEEIVASAEDGKSYACDVWMDVEVTRVYSEAEELLPLCEADAVAPSSGAARRRAPGAGDVCSICMDKSPTCPCCRRVMIYYLGPRQRQANAYMTEDAVMSLAAAEIVRGSSLRESAEAIIPHHGQPVSQVLQYARQLAREDAPHEQLVQFHHPTFW